MNTGTSAIRVVVFDLDGTLIDSAPDLHAAANRLMSELSLPTFDLATITSFIGNGLAKLVERCLAGAGEAGRGVDPDRAFERYKALYAEGASRLTRPYPGVVESLAALSEAGCRLGIVTNKSEGLALSTLADLGLAPHFEVVIGGDTLHTRKPEPEGLLLAVDRLGGMKADALFVGDSEVDAETAARAGLRFALFAGGYRKSPVSDMGHWHAFDDMRDLLRDRILPDVVAMRSLQAG